MPARFWFNGSGNWSDSAHWGTGSGGTGAPVAPPTSADTATFDGASGGGTVTIDTPPVMSTLTTGAFTGTLNFSAGHAVTIGSGGWSNSGTGARTITMGATVVTIAAGAASLGWGTSTNLTFNANTSEFILSGGTTTVTRLLTLGSTGLTYNKITMLGITSGFNHTSITTTVAAATINTLTINGNNYVILTTGFTFNVGTLVIDGSSGLIVSLTSAVLGTPATIALTNASTPDYAAFRDITFTGGSVTAANSFNQGRVIGATINEPAGGGGGGGTVGMVGG